MGYAFNTDGYLRATTVAGRAEELYEHRRVWAEANGPIPDGFHVHHIDEDRSNNRLENLALVSKAEHRRIHSNYLPDGVSKRCGCCDRVKPLALFPPRPGYPGSVRSQCWECKRANGREYKRARVSATRAS